MKNRFSLKTILLASALILIGAGCGGDDNSAASGAPVALEYWSVTHDSRVIGDLIDGYRRDRGNVTVRYRRFRPEEFEQALLEALAEDRGPDVLSINNTWVGKYQSKLLPAPKQLNVARVYTTGGQLSKKRVVEPEVVPTPTPQQVDRTFVKAAFNDVVRTDANGREQVWGLPMALDSMVLFYNQDMLDQSGVAQAPTTWNELQEAIVATTRYDADGNIIQAGASIGTGDNVDRSSDLISALMMQNGAVMADDFGTARFHQIPKSLESTALEAPGKEALRFYTDFANPTKQVYTWNNKMEQGFDAFTRGKSAFFFGYAYHIPQIKASAPKLNYRILQMPQLNPNNPKNIANYWIEGVSKKTKHPNEAWDLVLFLTRAQQADFYTKNTQKPTALRASVNAQLEDPDLAAFAAQSLNAQSWYTGANPGVADSALEEMIDFVHANRALEFEEDIFKDALERAASKINQSL